MMETRAFFVGRLAQSPADSTRADLQPAAVLIPIIDRPQQTVLFTLRADHLPTHAGQVSFPGGRVHAEDATVADTALRETHEEVGVATDHIEVVGYLDRYDTRTGYSIVPVVGLVHPDHELAPNAGEVAEAFEVPLDYLLDPASRVLKNRTRPNGTTMEGYEIAFGRHVIWGVTARIVTMLAERLRA